MQDSMRKLWSKSDRYYYDLMNYGAIGREMQLWDIFRNYFEQFRSIGEYVFSYEGIEKDLARQIEKRLFMYGRCGLVLKDGVLTAVNANPNGEDKYDDPTSFTFNYGGGLPDDSKTPEERVIGKDGVLGRNTFTFYPTAMIAEQYALMLAHTDISIICELVNGRFMDVLKAENNKAAESARKFSKDLYMGKLSFIEDKTGEIEVDRTSARNSHMREYLDTKNQILSEFYSIFGINKTIEKKERMISDEVNSSAKLLNFNLKDMLEMRKKMCDDIGLVFGVNVSVKSHIDIDADGNFENESEMDATNDQEKGVSDNV